MSDDRTGKTALVVGSAAAIAAAIALSKKTAAAPGGKQVVTLDETTMNLLVAIAQGIQNLNQSFQNLNQSFQNLIPGEPGQMVVQGWPPNTKGTLSFTVACVAAATAYQVSDVEIPDGMALAIKSSPLNAVGSLIFVARTPAECINPNTAWPLIPNEAITYFIKNAKTIYISSNVAGSIAIFTTEQGG